MVLTHGSSVSALAALADGRLASGGGDGTIKLWSTDGGSEPAVLRHGVQIVSLAVLSDGRLASGGGDGTIKLWPKDGSGEPVILRHGGPIVSLAALADGRLASAGRDGAIKLWSRDLRGAPQVLLHGSPLRSLAVLADGRLASGGLGGKIKLWLVDERKLLAALCLRAGRNFTNDEWARHVGSDTPWRPSCQAFGLPSNWRMRIKAYPREEGRYERGAASLRRRVRRDAYRSGNLFLDLEPERGRKHCIWVIFSMEWSGPLGADSDQAADLTVGRGLRSSNCCGLR